MGYKGVGVRGEKMRVAAVIFIGLAFVVGMHTGYPGMSNRVFSVPAIAFVCCGIPSAFSQFLYRVGHGNIFYTSWVE